MNIVLAAILLSAAQPQVPGTAIEPLEPNFCGAYLNLLQFENGSSRLSTRSRTVLDDLVRTLRSNSYVSRVRLTGNADRVGSRRANLALARRRALAARAYLIAQGIAPTNITVAAEEEGAVMPTADGVAFPDSRLVFVFEEVPAEIINRWNAWISIHGASGPVC